MKEGALYRIICQECKRKETRSEYWGETGRNCFLRGGEHWKGWKNKEEDNALWKHVWERHEGKSEENMYEMKMERNFRKPLARQIREGVELEMSGANILMNSKSEWNHSRIPRIVIESGEDLKEDEESGMGRESTVGKKKEKERTEKERSKKGSVGKFEGRKRQAKESAVLSEEKVKL